MLSGFFKRIIWFFLFILLIAVSQDAQAKFYDNSYALVIGINKYPSARWQNLKYATKDAEGMAEFLKEQNFFVITLFDQQATKESIISNMEEYIAPRVKKNDRILFFFAGHGHTKFLAGRDWGYIIPFDGTESSATYISMDEIRILSEKMGAAKHQLFIMDACYGGLLGTKAGGVDPNIPNYIKKITERKAKQIITAGGKDQTVLDGGPNGHSVFTGNLLEALREGLADTNDDGYISFTELTSYIVPVATNAYQTPAFGILPGHGLGEFVFRSPKGVKNIISAAPIPSDELRRSEGYPEELAKKIQRGLAKITVLHQNGSDSLFSGFIISLDSFNYTADVVTVLDVIEQINDINVQFKAESGTKTYRATFIANETRLKGVPEGMAILRVRLNSINFHNLLPLQLSYISNIQRGDEVHIFGYNKIQKGYIRAFNERAMTISPKLERIIRGAPVIKDEKVVGLVHRQVEFSNSSTFAISNLAITRFLSDHGIGLIRNKR
jgi:hypothetical protein